MFSGQKVNADGTKATPKKRTPRPSTAVVQESTDSPPVSALQPECTYQFFWRATHSGFF